MGNTITETIGCDLGDKTSEMCVLSEDGSRARATVRTTRKGMTEVFTRAETHVVIEVGAHSRWVSEVVKELRHRVTVANPRRVQLISGSDNKTDRHDAKLLARLSRPPAGHDASTPVQQRRRAGRRRKAYGPGER